MFLGSAFLPEDGCPGLFQRLPWAGCNLGHLPVHAGVSASVGLESGSEFLSEMPVLARTGCFQHASNCLTGVISEEVEQKNSQKHIVMRVPIRLLSGRSQVRILPGAPIQHTFLCCLLIGARAGNIKTMRWVDLDLDGGIWTIPATKGGSSMEVALPTPVVTLLETRLKAARRAVEDLRTEQHDGGQHLSPYVFATSSRTGHLIEYKKAWEQVCATAGLSDLRVHDLRRTLSSFAQESGAGISVVAAQLGHSDAETTLRHYTAVGTVVHRPAMDTTAQAILQAAGVKL